MRTPDRMTWYLAVRNTGEDLSAVAKQHIAIVENVLQYLKRQKLPKEEIQTAKMEFGIDREYKNGQ